MRQVTANQYRKILKQVMEARIAGLKDGKDLNLPYFVWGPPGVGKSEILADLFNEQDWVLYDVRGSQLDPVDFRGMPIYDNVNEVAKFVRFSSILPPEDSKKQGVIFIDEFPQSPEMVQSAAYQLINDRRVGDYRLPDGFITFAAGNREEDGGVYFEIPPALKDRFAHIELPPDHDSFVRLMNLRYSDENLLSYITYQLNNDKEKLYNFNPANLIFPTFRSWEKVFKFAAYGMDTYDLIADNLGEHIAVDYQTFVELVKQIPSPEKLIKDKIFYGDIQKQIIACQKITNYILSDKCKSKWNAFKYYVDMEDPNNKKNKRQELTILFLVNLKSNFTLLEDLEPDYLKDKDYFEKGKPMFDTVFKFMKHKWSVLNDLGSL